MSPNTPQTFLGRCGQRLDTVLAWGAETLANLGAKQAAIVLLAFTAVGFWMSAGIWGPGLPAGLDMARHFWRARVLHDIFLPAGHVNGWSPYWHLGLEQFLFQSYGYYLVMALTERLTLGLIDFLTIFKFFVAAPLALLPPALFALARSVGLARASSLAAALVVLAVTVGTGFGVKGWFAVGLLLQGPGVLLVAVALVFATRGIPNRCPDGSTQLPQLNWAFVMGAAVATGAALVTHFISGAYLLAAVWIYAFGVSSSERSLLPFARAIVFAAVALALSAHTLDRTIQLQDFIGQPVGWGKNTPMPRILAADFFAPFSISIIAYFGTAAALLSRRQGITALAWMFVLTVFLAAGPRFELPFEVMNEILESVFRPRSMPAACLVFPVLFAYGLETIWALLTRWATQLTLPVAIPRLLFVAILIAPAAATFDRIDSLQKIPRSVRAADSTEALPFEAAIEWLNANVEAPAVVGFELDVFHSRESGSPRFASLLNDRTGLFALGGDQSEATDVRHHRMSEPDRLTQMAPHDSAAALRRLSVSHVMVRDPVARERLRNSQEFVREFAAGTVEIFSIPGPHQFAQGLGISVHDLDFQPEHIRWDIQNRGLLPSLATLAVSRHPNWTAELDGEPVELVESKGKLLTVKIQPGRHRLDLRWQRSNREHAANWLSFLTLCVAAAVILRGRKQPPARP